MCVGEMTVLINQLMAQNFGLCGYERKLCMDALKNVPPECLSRMSRDAWIAFDKTGAEIDDVGVRKASWNEKRIGVTWQSVLPMTIHMETHVKSAIQARDAAMKQVPQLAIEDVEVLGLLEAEASGAGFSFYYKLRNRPSSALTACTTR